MRAKDFLNENLSTDELQQVEKFADALWKKKGIDVDFTKHFGDRVNDPRNGKPISAAELVRIFKKEYERNGKDVQDMEDTDAVFKDRSTKINVPFALNNMYDKKNMVATTVMRKDNFYAKPGQPEFVVNEEDLTEIERLSTDDYTGGKSELQYVKKPGKKRVMPLPGGSGLQYAIIPEGRSYTIAIIDPNHVETEPRMNRWEWRDEYEQRLAKWEHMKAKGQLKAKPQVIGKLSVYGGNQGIPGALKVGAITVDEDYRGIGIAKALYGIVLTIMKKPLIAGGEQTPGGRRNWMSLASIPGVEVKGFVQIDNDDVNYDPRNDGRLYGSTKQQVDKNHDMLMQLGGQYLAKNEWSEFWMFDVVPGNGELKPAIKNKLSTLYSRHGEEPTGLIAYWTGQ